MPPSHEYAPDRRIAVHGTGDAALALFWHGRGPHEAYALSQLADAVAAQGIRVLVADWDASADDHGKADLSASLTYAQGLCAELGIDPERIILVGWSLGGTAALGLALQSAQPLRTVLIAPGYAERAADAFSGLPLPEVFPPASGPIDVFWGNRDDLVDETMATALADRLRDAGWDVTATELDADHSGVVGVRFDEDLDRYVHDPKADASAAQVAAVIAGAATRP